MNLNVHDVVRVRWDKKQKQSETDPAVLVITTKYDEHRIAIWMAPKKEEPSDEFEDSEPPRRA